MHVTAEKNLTTIRAQGLGWSVFLGVSWTWCIGMFLPVLLVRDYGIWGWIAFAIPNILGAAAMGWVVKSAHHSLDLVATHRQACMMFSGVTIAFHMFFVVSVLGREPLGTSIARMQPMDLALGSVIALSIIMYLLMTRQRGGERGLAVIALLVSLAAMALVISQAQGMVIPTPQPAKEITSLLWLAPVCCFGFGFCPYLDLTFHRAAQHTTSPRAAFGIGFGAVFFLMIIFTLIYSRLLLADVPRLLGAALLVHMAVQSSFTLAAHARELRRHGARAAIVAAALTGMSWIALWSLRRGDVIRNLHSGELIYRIFMGFYGLVFPAYVWLVMLPGGGPTPRKLLIYIVAVLAALPMFWMGFVVGQMVWLGPGLAIVLLARLLVRRGYAAPRAP